LNIAFHTKALRSLSESQTLASRKLGKDVAGAFHARLADVEVARNPEDLPLGFIPSEESSIGFTLPLVDHYFAIFESNHSSDREAAPAAKIEWSRVNRVKLMAVERRND
jgi:hypothetical protein